MCSLKEEPWRESFTGAPCRCGVPMPGNEEEEQIHEANRIAKYGESFALDPVGHFHLKMAKEIAKKIDEDIMNRLMNYDQENTDTSSG